MSNDRISQQNNQNDPRLSTPLNKNNIKDEALKKNFHLFDKDGDGQIAGEAELRNFWGTVDANNKAKKELGLQKQSARQIVEDLIDATSGWNDTKAIQNAIAKIDNPDELAEINRLLIEHGYKADDKYSPIEKFIYEENNNSWVHTYNSTEFMEETVQKWIKNGTLKGAKANEAQARMAARVIFDGGDGFGTDCEKIKKGIALIKCPSPTGDKKVDNANAKAVYDLVNNIIKKHRTFYGMGSTCNDLRDYCKGEMWEGEVRYLDGILAENNAVQGENKAEVVKNLVSEAVSGGGTDIEYLKQAIRTIDSPEDRASIEIKLKEYCRQKKIKPQIEGQDYLQAILYDECDTFMGISKDHKEIRKFNEMLIEQGAYKPEEVVKLRAEQAALQILEGDFANIKDALSQVKDKAVYEQIDKILHDNGHDGLKSYLFENLDSTEFTLAKAELAANGIYEPREVAEIAFTLIRNPEFDNRAVGFKIIRSTEVATLIDNRLKDDLRTSLVEVLDTFNAEKAEYNLKADIWDGLAIFGNPLFEAISDNYRENTDMEDVLYLESPDAHPLTDEQRASYDMAIKTFESGLEQMRKDYQDALDSQGVVSDAVNRFCELHNIGTTREEIEARIAHDTETLRLLKVAGEGKLTKIVDGKQEFVGFEEIWATRQSVEISSSGGIDKTQTVTTFQTDKVQKVAQKAQTIAAMDYAKDAIVVCWDELTNVKDQKTASIAIVNTLDKLSKMSGKQLSLDDFGWDVSGSYIVDKNANPPVPVKYEELMPVITRLRTGLSEVAESLFNIDMSYANNSNIKDLLEDGYEAKMEGFKQEYRDAFGQDVPDEVIKDYVSTIETGKIVLNIGVMIGAAIAAPFTGGGSLAIFAATAGASFGLNALEKSTDADGYTNSEWTNDLSQAAWDGALAVVGVKVGQYAEAFAKGVTGPASFNKWMAAIPEDKMPQVIKKSTEIAEKLMNSTAKVGDKVYDATFRKLSRAYYYLPDAKLKMLTNAVVRAESCAIEVGSDALQSFVQMYCMEGEIDSVSFWSAFALSLGANSIGHGIASRQARSSGKVVDLSDLNSKITKENFLGGGAEAQVYDLGDGHVVRFIGSTSTLTDRAFRPVEDVFEGRNFGQAVVVNRTGDIQVCKKVEGTKLYTINDVTTNANLNPEDYLVSLREYADLPDETLEQFADDVAFINSKGYRIDEGNAENFLYDRQTGVIGIIDIQPKNTSSLDFYEPYAHDWLLKPLVNSHDISRIYEKMTPEQRKEMFALITKLEDRILPLADKYGIPRASWNTEDYQYSNLQSILQIRDKIDYTNPDLRSQSIDANYPDVRAAMDKSKAARNVSSTDAATRANVDAPLAKPTIKIPKNPVIDQEYKVSTMINGQKLYTGVNTYKDGSKVVELIIDGEPLTANSIPATNPTLPKDMIGSDSSKLYLEDGSEVVVMIDNFADGSREVKLYYDDLVVTPNQMFKIPSEGDVPVTLQVEAPKTEVSKVDVPTIPKEKPVSIPAVPIGEATKSARLSSGQTLKTDIIFYSDGSKSVELYVGGKYVKGNTSAPTDPSIPPVPVSHGTQRLRLEDGTEIEIEIINLLNGSHQFNTRINGKSVDLFTRVNPDADIDVTTSVKNVEPQPQVSKPKAPTDVAPVRRVQASSAVGDAKTFKPYMTDMAGLKLKPEGVEIPRLNPDEIAEESICLVHMDEYAPTKDGMILSARDALTDENGVAASRNSVHFSLNHPVEAHRAGDWDNSPYAILMPFTATKNANVPGKFIEGLPNDLYTNGSVKIPEGSVIIKRNPDIPEGQLKVSPHPDIPGVKLIETSGSVHESVSPIMEKMGYSTSLAKSGAMGIFDEGISNTDPTALIQGTAKRYDAWNRFCQSQGLKPMLHSGSPNGRAETMIECIDMLATTNSWTVGSWSSGSVNYKKSILQQIKELKEYQKQGYFVAMDLDKFAQIIKESKSPEVALARIEKEMKLKPILHRERKLPSDTYNDYTCSLDVRLGSSKYSKQGMKFYSTSPDEPVDLGFVEKQLVWELTMMKYDASGTD